MTIIEAIKKRYCDKVINIDGSCFVIVNVRPALSEEVNWLIFEVKPIYYPFFPKVDFEYPVFRKEIMTYYGVKFYGWYRTSGNVFKFIIKLLHKAIQYVY
jgi:hypothetical protein